MVNAIYNRDRQGLEIGQSVYQLGAGGMEGIAFVLDTSLTP